MGSRVSLVDCGLAIIPVEPHYQYIPKLEMVREPCDRQLKITVSTVQLRPWPFFALGARLSVSSTARAPGSRAQARRLAGPGSIAARRSRGGCHRASPRLRREQALRCRFRTRDPCGSVQPKRRDSASASSSTRRPARKASPPPLRNQRMPSGFGGGEAGRARDARDVRDPDLVRNGRRKGGPGGQPAGGRSERSRRARRG
jgi:hypothetical protein